MFFRNVSFKLTFSCGGGGGGGVGGWGREVENYIHQLPHSKLLSCDMIFGCELFTCYNYVFI